MGGKLDWRRARRPAGRTGAFNAGLYEDIHKGPNVKTPDSIKHLIRKGHKNSLKSRIQGAQAISAHSRKSRGIKPSMPDFGLDKNDPAVVAAQLTREDRLKDIAMDAVDGNLADIILEQNGMALIRVMLSKGKAKTVCVEIETGKVEWVEAE